MKRYEDLQKDCFQEGGSPFLVAFSGHLPMKGTLSYCNCVVSQLLPIFNGYADLQMRIYSKIPTFMLNWKKNYSENSVAIKDLFKRILLRFSPKYITFSYVLHFLSFRLISSGEMDSETMQRD